MSSLRRLLKEETGLPVSEEAAVYMHHLIERVKDQVARRALKAHDAADLGVRLTADDVAQAWEALCAEVTIDQRDGALAYACCSPARASDAPSPPLKTVGNNIINSSQVNGKAGEQRAKRN